MRHPSFFIIKREGCSDPLLPHTETKEMRPIEQVNLLLWEGGDGDEGGVEVDGFFASLVASILHFFHQLLHSISSFFKGGMAGLKAPILHLFNLLVDQFSWIPRLWVDIAISLVGKLEEALPPEHPGRGTLLVLVQLAMAVVLILGVALLVCLVRALVMFLKICVVEAVKLIRALVVGVWRWKMMKAPGRPGVLIPRDLFEDDPRGYFSRLRASRGARSLT